MTWPWVWFAAYTLVVAMAAGSAGALVMAVLVGGRRADVWRELKAREARERTLNSIGRRP